MDKKGSMTKLWLYLFYVVINMIVLVLFILYINQLAGEKGETSDFLSKDLGLITDTLHNSLNPIKFTYYTTSNYNFNIDQSSLSISKQLDANGIKYFYTRDNNLKISDVHINVKENSHLIFDKNKGILVSTNG